MPWSSPLISEDGQVLPHVLIRRLAYYINTRQGRNRRTILSRAKISDSTLKRYAVYDAGPDGDDRCVGPQKLLEFISICLAIGDNPARVLFAAQHSTDAASFERLMQVNLIAEDTLSIIGGNGQVEAVSHTLRLAS